MTLAMLQTYISTLTKDRIIGFGFDNSRRANRRILRTKPATVEAFDDRFEIDATLEAVVIIDKDPTGIPFKTYIPVENVQAVYAVDDSNDAVNIDRRYSLG